MAHKFLARILGHVSGPIPPTHATPHNVPPTSCSQIQEPRPYQKLKTLSSLQPSAKARCKIVQNRQTGQGTRPKSTTLPARRTSTGSGQRSPRDP
ncbi:hypothetical protein T439DRAFT_205414 [Meredithblackwellia eburnea MCA 4105]